MTGPPTPPAPAPLRWGVLLLQLGTPDAPEPAAVRRYLRQFLSDPRVIDLPAAARWLLLNAVILPFRPRRSAAAYRAIWTAAGSPLRIASARLTAAVAAALGDEVVGVELAMRYGRPSVAAGVARLLDAGAVGIVALPLFPQYSRAAWESAMVAVFDAAAAAPAAPALRVVPPFYAEPEFLDAAATVARPVLASARADAVLMSFHGVPERHLRRSERSAPAACLSAGCCDAIRSRNRFCYRAQCFATARGLAARLDLAARDYDVAFQSRLGRTRWIGPATEDRITALAAAGVRRLAVLCPSFVADCLETLEEIGIRARQQFRAAGGDDLLLVPCVDDHATWVAGVAGLCRRHLPPAMTLP